MYNPNNREELEVMQSVMPITAFGTKRTGKKAERADMPKTTKTQGNGVRVTVGAVKG